MRVFLDTNVLVSALATRGLCADVLREILVSHQLVISAPLVAELTNTLHTKIGIPQDTISDFIDLLHEDAVLSEDTPLLDIIINDKDDVPIVSTAVNGHADVFVTGDKELLELVKIQSMRIVSPRSFWEMLKTQPADNR